MIVDKDIVKGGILSNREASSGPEMGPIAYLLLTIEQMLKISATTAKTSANSVDDLSDQMTQYSEDLDQVGADQSGLFLAQKSKNAQNEATSISNEINEISIKMGQSSSLMSVAGSSIKGLLSLGHVLSQAYLDATTTKAVT